MFSKNLSGYYWTNNSFLILVRRVQQHAQVAITWFLLLLSLLNPWQLNLIVKRKKKSDFPNVLNTSPFGYVLHHKGVSALMHRNSWFLSVLHIIFQLVLDYKSSTRANGLRGSRCHLDVSHVNIPHEKTTGILVWHFRLKTSGLRGVC